MLIRRSKKHETSQGKIMRHLTDKKLRIRIISCSRFFGWTTADGFRLLTLSLSGNLCLAKLFSSCESEARLSDSYSWTTSQPSSFLSAILISFCRFLIFVFPYSTNLRTSTGLSALSPTWVRYYSNASSIQIALGWSFLVDFSALLQFLSFLF